MATQELPPIRPNGPNNVEIGSNYTFRHTVTGEDINVPIDTAPKDRLRYICQPNGITDERNRKLFLALFPEDLPIKDSTEESVMHHKDTHLDGELKKVWRDFIGKVFGYKSPRKVGDEDETQTLEDLRVGIITKSFVGQIAEMPIIKRLKGVNQTYPDLGDNPPHKARTRYDHSLHMGRAYVQTLTRFALLQPELFVEAVQKALQETSIDNFDQIREKIENINLKIDTSLLSDPQISALKHAEYYGRIGLLYAILHDVYTPGFGDRFMKAKAKYPKEKSIKFNENEILKVSIEEMASKYKNLNQLLVDSDMDTATVVSMIQSYASGGDTTLNSLMMKAKFVGVEPIFGDSAEPMYDLDQESGTIANMVGLVDHLLPGGHLHKKKDDPMPIGSFEERSRLLSYMMLTGMTKEDLQNMLGQIGFDDEMQKRIYIAAEEYSMWHNMQLRKVVSKSGQEHIVPVSLIPGDYKKATLAQNILYSMFYRGTQMDVSESLWQRILVNYLDDDGGNIPILTPDDFIGKTDQEVVTVLKEKAPELLYMLERFDERGRILTSEEYHRLVAESQARGRIILAIHEPSYGVFNEKPGTLAVGDIGGVRRANVIVDRQRRTYFDNPNSVIKRIDAAKEAVSGDYFKVLELNQDEWSELKEFLTNSGHKDIFMRGLRHWMRYPQFEAQSK